MAKTLTELELKAKTKQDAGQRVSDGEGLVGNVRLNRAGKVVVGFEYRYRSPSTGKLRAIGCGKWPDVSLKSIRAQRDVYRTSVNSVVDPLETKEAEKLAAKADCAEVKQKAAARLTAVSAAQARMTVQGVFDRWQKTELVNRKDGGVEVRRMFSKDVFPHIGEMALEDVRKGHVMAIVDNLKGRGVPRMTRVVFSLIRQMMRFAVDRDFIENDPTAAIRKEKAVGKDAERDRVLLDDEIRVLSEKLPDAGLSDSVRVAVWIMLSTLCRVGELSKAKWTDLDLEARQWRIPPEVAKNGSEHVIILSDFAVEQFRILRAAQTSMEWLYPCRDGSSYLDEKTITKQVRDRQRAEQLKGRAKPNSALLLPRGQWTSHDLRRTGATLMGELGVPGDTIERCLNHKEQNKMKRTYQRQKNEQAMAEAWHLLGERLELLTSGADNVVLLHSGAA